MYSDKDGIDWALIRNQVKSRAKQFVDADDSDKVWYIGGEIVDSAIVSNIWDDNIRKVCEWQIENGKGHQPIIAKDLIDKNS